MNPQADQAEKLPSSRAAWISIREISQVCHLGQSTIRKLIAQNCIPHLRVGRKILIPREAFVMWWDTESVRLRIPSATRLPKPELMANAHAYGSKAVDGQ